MVAENFLIYSSTVNCYTHVHNKLFSALPFSFISVCFHRCLFHSFICPILTWNEFLAENFSLLCIWPNFPGQGSGLWDWCWFTNCSRYGTNCVGCNVDLHCSLAELVQGLLFWFASEISDRRQALLYMLLGLGFYSCSNTCW